MLLAAADAKRYVSATQRHKVQALNNSHPRILQALK